MENDYTHLLGAIPRGANRFFSMPLRGVQEFSFGSFTFSKTQTQEKRKVRREAEVLRSLIQSAFVVQLVGLYESPLNSVLVTEYLAGGDLITRCFTSLFNFMKVFLGVSFSKFQNPCSNYRAIKYPRVSIEIGKEYPPVSIEFGH